MFFLPEYDALAKVIQQHPDRQETLRLVIDWYCDMLSASSADPLQSLGFKPKCQGKDMFLF